MTGVPDNQQVITALRNSTREARETLRDLRQATKEAQAVVQTLDTGVNWRAVADDVAAVLAEADLPAFVYTASDGCPAIRMRTNKEAAEQALAALAAANCAVMKLPEGMVVPHGSRLVQRNSEARVGYEFGPLYAIENSP